MSLIEKINADIKAALIAGDKVTVTTLKSVKNTLLYSSVSEGSRGQEPADDVVLAAIQKEVKKRKEAIELYAKAAAIEKQQNEEQELKVLLNYLPVQLSEEEVSKIVGDAINSLQAETIKDMGRVIGAIKSSEKASQIDGAMLASIVKKQLS